jgi:2,3-bisphosphoglycerate-dependent phosphoglycerate mutase
MSTTFIVVRHGETEWNKIGIQQGHLNSPLTALGIKQAKAMGEGLQSFPIDLIFSSDLGRATETAAIISKIIGKPFTTDIRLRERHLGIMQGLTQAQFAQKYPEDAARFKSHDPDYAFPTGESARQRYTRCVACLEDFALRFPGKTILIVAHGGVLMSFIHRALNIPLDAKRTYSLFNASINVFTIDQDKSWRLDIWGDTNHLRKHSLSTIDDN